MSPTSRPLDSAGVLGSMADTTTGLEPWMRKPNSPLTRSTLTNLLHSGTEEKALTTHFQKEDEL